MASKILLVDDSQSIRKITKKSFRSFDCELLEAGDGVEALQLAGSERPDMIILDITMPKMDGVEVLEKLKSDASLQNIPVIMLSAIKDEDKILQVVRMGASDYVRKPFKGEELIERVKKCINLETAKP